MKSAQEELLRRHFDDLMQAARTMGWWVTLDYQVNGPLRIYANHLGLSNRTYQGVTYRTPPSLEDHLKWIALCADGLVRAADLAYATLATQQQAVQVLVTARELAKPNA